jgi:hypothetical protein
MDNAMKIKLALLLTILICLLVVGAVVATSAPNASWNVMAGGGGKSTSGNIVLQDTIGQPIIGSSSGGNINLNAGFWQVLAVRFSTFLPFLKN